MIASRILARQVTACGPLGKTSCQVWSLPCWDSNWGRSCELRDSGRAYQMRPGRFLRRKKKSLLCSCICRPGWIYPKERHYCQLLSLLCTRSRLPEQAKASQSHRAARSSTSINGRGTTLIPLAFQPSHSGPIDFPLPTLPPPLIQAHTKTWWIDTLVILTREGLRCSLSCAYWPFSTFLVPFSASPAMRLDPFAGCPRASMLPCH